MSLSNDDVDMAVRVVKRLMSNGVTGTHHKQPQTVSGWFATHERGRVKDVLEDMATDPDVPVRVKGGRGTVQLTGMDEAMEFLKEHGAEDPRGW